MRVNKVIDKSNTMRKKIDEIAEKERLKKKDQENEDKLKELEDKLLY